MFRLFSEFLTLPFTVFVSSVEAFAGALKSVQQAVESEIAGVAGSQSTLQRCSTQDPAARPAPPPGAASGKSETASSNNPSTKEYRTMPDQDLSGNGEQLKLVRYKILFVKRDLEAVLQDEKEELISTEMDAASYSAWKTAEFVQDIARHPAKIPAKWKKNDDIKYPPKEYRESEGSDGKFKQDDDGHYYSGLPGDDKRFLRVYFEVMQRYPREKTDYEQRQLEALEDIGHTLKTGVTTIKKP